MPINGDLLLLLKSNMLGEGEPDLGEKLLKSFLEQLFESESLPIRIICMNSGIFLSTSGSPVEEILMKFQAAGSQIYSCSTCLNYYNRADKLIVGEASNMKETVAAMLKFSKILAP